MTIKRLINKNQAWLNFKRQLKNTRNGAVKLTFVLEAVKFSFYGFKFSFQWFGDVEV